MNTELIKNSIRNFARADFSRSSGPGGQNVNKLNTKVTLRIHLDDIKGLLEAETRRLEETLASRINGERELVITSSEERSQRINLERSYSRMEALILTAARVPRTRRPTKPSRAAREERLRSKRLTASKKAERRNSALRDEE